ncbi:MAG: hypothetical protein ACRC0V_06850, partial [Fusobacteriaceae bacterium]
MKNKKEDNGGVTIQQVKWSQSSENYDMETLYDIDNNEELIRVEMNTIEYPLFTKNKRINKNNIITYEFNNTNNQYLKVTPLAEYRIPGDFEEKIFFALMKLYKANGHDQTIYTDITTLISEMRVAYSGKTVKMVKAGLKILSGTTYEFNNLFYSNEARKIVSDNIQTNMFSIRTIQFSEAQKIENPEMIKCFRNSKIKEVIQVKFTGHFYDNIIRKGYLYFDRQDLLQIENAVARTLYMMITKWRNKELYVRRYSKFLASRVPLSWKKKNISGTLKLLNEAFQLLNENKVISRFRFNNEKGSELSYFEIWFDETHNKPFIKKSLEFNPLEEEFEITNQIKELMSDLPIIESEVTKETRELLALLPEKAKTLTTMEGKVEKAIKKYGYDYTRGAVLYTNTNAKSSFGKYFDGTIAQNWHEEFM